jgi:hypothetical protein
VPRLCNGIKDCLFNKVFFKKTVHSYVKIEIGPFLSPYTKNYFLNKRENLPDIGFGGVFFCGYDPKSTGNIRKIKLEFIIIKPFVHLRIL